MPKGFLVKRTGHSGSYSHRFRNISDDERSESGSDQEYLHANFGSPDSGYSASPISAALRECHGQLLDYSGARSPISSPITVQSATYLPLVCYTQFVSSDADLKTPSKLVSPENVNGQEQSIKSCELNGNTVRPAASTTGTPLTPNKRRGKSENVENKGKMPKKPNAARKINFDEDTSSPVSGTIIRNLSELDSGGRVICGDIDSKFNCVEVTTEAKAEIAKIENKIGAYICQLCKELFQDAFQLAQHRCSMIVHIEYRCPECEKVFNCPANLASHRRWHKPRPNGPGKSAKPQKILPVSSTEESKDTVKPQSPREERQYACDKCGKKFRRQAYLRKHQLCHVSDSIFVCQYCSKIFPNDTACARHEMTHIGGKELTCTLCNTSFQNKIVLEKHVRQHGNDTFDCKYCESSFCSSPGLTRHINKCHPSENRQVILLQLPVNRPC